MHVKLIVAGLLLAPSTAAQAASALAVGRTQGQSHTAAGFASASHAEGEGFASASGYEYGGAVGVFATASSQAGRNSDNRPQASAEAGSTKFFRVGRLDKLPELGNGVFQLDVSIRATGSVATSQTPASNGAPMTATALYNYNFAIGSFSGFGGVYSAVYGTSGENGTFRTVTEYQEKGLGAAGTFSDILLVRLDEVVRFQVGANAFASGGSYGGAEGGGSASGEANFGNTLKWLGVSRIRYQDVDGQFYDAPEGYRLSLMDTDGSFDYWNAAGPNPFVSSVPEPASWAMMIAGFALAGAAVRSAKLGPDRTRLKLAVSIC
jgi:hypothetical protein